MSYAEPSASLEKDISRKIILLEANEIPSRVLDFYVTQNPESRLAEILPVCRRY
jgi:hypothetical protein